MMKHNQKNEKCIPNRGDWVTVDMGVVEKYAQVPAYIKTVKLILNKNNGRAYVSYVDERQKLVEIKSNRRTKIADV